MNAVAQLLSTSDSSDNAVAAQVRYNLTVAIQAAASLQSLTSANVAVLVQSLNAVASDPSQLSTDSLELILGLTTQLASLAGSAASEFLTIIANLNAYIATITDLQTTTDAAAQAATIQANIAGVVTSLLEDALCDQAAQSVSTDSLQVTGQKSSNLGNTTFASSTDGSSASFGPDFNPVADACTEIHLIASSTNAYAYVNTSASLPTNATGLTVSSTTFTLNFYNADSGESTIVADLSPDGSISLSFSVPNALNDSVQCVFFNETTRVWDDAGCVKSLDTTDDLLVCTCNHATTFAVGNFQLDITAVVIPTSINPNSVGLIASTVAVAGLVVLYILFASIAIWKDRQSIATAETPSEAELRYFAERYHELYDRPAPRSVLATVPNTNE